MSGSTERCVAVLGRPQGAEPPGAAAQRVPRSADAGGQQAAVRPAVDHRPQLLPAGRGLDERWVPHTVASTSTCWVLFLVSCVFVVFFLVWA